MVFDIDAQVRARPRAERSRAAGRIVGRFVGSGHFNISPEHALGAASRLGGRVEARGKRIVREGDFRRPADVRGVSRKRRRA
ncbi:hypothetical protein [Burkholderia ubonensis]|uniref:hypothetical protein n=1 Tax=Burkholderia ubonensis TaxID=101571 RepID=UPI0012F78693|nr:hypothetical protein [Burkholderia ubonensis]